MARILTKDKLNQHKDKALQELTKLLDTLIASDNPKVSAKADILSFWLETYCKYLNAEKTFVPSSLKRYERGDVIQVNFGYRVGSEHGGLHYAVVLDKANALNSPIITVIPLGSLESSDDVTKYDVPLGSEIYTKMKLKNDSLYQTAKIAFEGLTEKQETIRQLQKSLIDDEDADLKLTAILEQYEKEVSQLELDLKLLQKMKKQILKMKNGSLALVGQITTISKLRIYNPKGYHDTLSGIKLSPKALDSISAKMKELYFFE